MPQQAEFAYNPQAKKYDGIDLTFKIITRVQHLQMNSQVFISLSVEGRPGTSVFRCVTLC